MRSMLMVTCVVLVNLAQAGIDKNLLKNPSFETGDFARWSVWGDQDVVWRIGSGEDAYAGNLGAVFETSAKTSTEGVWYGVFQEVDVVPGKTYGGSAWLRLGNADWNTVKLEVKWIDDKGKETNASASESYAQASSVHWKYFEAKLPEAVAPARAVRAKVQVVIFLTGDPTGASYTTFDQVVFGQVKKNKE
jgi:hypothetical protein